MTEIIVRRTRWPEGSTEQEIRDAAQNEEREDFRTKVKLLLNYFKFPGAKEYLKPMVDAFLEKEDITPAECCKLYQDLCFFDEEDVLGYMEVGNSVYAKFKIYWVSPEMEAAYIFEYDTSDDSVDSDEDEEDVDSPSEEMDEE